jgi:autoinducer 2-degrading protein
MFVTTVSIKVKEAYIAAFIGASLENHVKSIEEPGNLRFDILQSMDDPSLFTFYEAYETKNHALAHKETEHYAKWRDAVAPYMEIPRVGTAHHALAPLEITKWK